MTHPPSRLRRRIALLATTLALVAACGTSGTDLRDPPVGVTSPAPTTTATSTTVPPVFTVFSPAFPMAGEVPDTFTCAGEGLSPPVRWVGVPAATVELALTVTTPGADGNPPTVHWILAGLPADTEEIPENSVPLSAIEGPNSDGSFAWLPPCVEGDALGQMQFQLHALEQPSALAPQMSADEALAHLLSLPATRTISSGTVTSGSAANEPDSAPTTVAG